jgi:hypothetical protein
MVVAVGPFLIVHALILSAVLAWLRGRGQGPAAVGGGALAVLVIYTVLELSAGPALGRRAIQVWALFVLAPTVVVFAVSLLRVFVNRPWLLMILGPVSFVFSVLVLMVAYNVSANR